MLAVYHKIDFVLHDAQECIPMYKNEMSVIAFGPTSKPPSISR
jgi:hypothetical protein